MGSGTTKLQIRQTQPAIVVKTASYGISPEYISADKIHAALAESMAPGPVGIRTGRVAVTSATLLPNRKSRFFTQLNRNRSGYDGFGA